MFGKHLKYNLGFRLAMLFMPMLFLGSCKLISFFQPEIYEDICEETEFDKEALDRYYDSLRMLESQHFHDSCEWVLQAEWDSVLRMVSPTVSFSELLADSIVEYAMTFLGVPYVHGGNGPTKFDCSGFTRYVFRRYGYSLTRTATGQLHDGWKEIKNTTDLRRGDLVFFGGRRNVHQLGHVAIVVDNYPDEHYFTFIHATVKRGVMVSKSDEKYYKIRYLTACRILPE